jgi:hypothetical protein
VRIKPTRSQCDRIQVDNASCEAAGVEAQVAEQIQKIFDYVVHGYVA